MAMHEWFLVFSSSDPHAEVFLHLGNMYISNHADWLVLELGSLKSVEIAWP